VNAARAIAYQSWRGTTYDCCIREHTGDPEACGGSPDDFKDKFRVEGPDQPNPVDPKGMKPQVQCEPQPQDVKPIKPGLGCKAAFDVCMGAAMNRSGAVRVAFAAMCVAIYVECLARGG